MFYHISKIFLQVFFTIKPILLVWCTATLPFMYLSIWEPLKYIMPRCISNTNTNTWDLESLNTNTNTNTSKSVFKYNKIQILCIWPQVWEQRYQLSIFSSNHIISSSRTKLQSHDNHMTITTPTHWFWKSRSVSWAQTLTNPSTERLSRGFKPS